VGDHSKRGGDEKKFQVRGREFGLFSKRKIGGLASKGSFRGCEKKRFTDLRGHNLASGKIKKERKGARPVIKGDHTLKGLIV